MRNHSKTFSLLFLQPTKIYPSSIFISKIINNFIFNNYFYFISKSSLFLIFFLWRIRNTSTHYSFYYSFWNCVFFILYGNTHDFFLVSHWPARWSPIPYSYFKFSKMNTAVVSHRSCRWWISDILTDYVPFSKE